MLLSPSSPKPMAEKCTRKKSDLWLKLVLENVLTPSIGCLGIFGNCVAIDTLRHPTIKTTFNQSLVCRDILFLVMMILNQSSETAEKGQA